MEPTREIVKTGTWLYGDVRCHLRLVKCTWDLVQHRTIFYAQRHSYPNYTDEEFAKEYVEEELPLTNDRGESYQAEFEIPAYPGRYFQSYIYKSLDEAVHRLSEQPYHVSWDDELTKIKARPPRL